MVEVRVLQACFGAAACVGQSSLERSGSLDKLASPPATPNTQVVLKVAMACGGCSGAVERVLAKMEGEVAQGQKAFAWG